MTLRAFASILRHTLNRSRLLQAALVVGFWFIGNAVVAWTGLPIPGGIVGMALVLLLLASHRLDTASMRRGAEWLLGDMLLFFVPAVLAVMNHREFLGLLGLKILAVILLGTVTVMGVTALAIDLCYRWAFRHEATGHAAE